VYNDNSNGICWAAERASGLGLLQVPEPVHFWGNGLTCNDCRNKYKYTIDQELYL